MTTGSHKDPHPARKKRQRKKHQPPISARALAGQRRQDNLAYYVKEDGKTKPHLLGDDLLDSYKAGRALENFAKLKSPYVQKVGLEVVDDHLRLRSRFAGTDSPLHRLCILIKNIIRLPISFSASNPWIEMVVALAHQSEFGYLFDGRVVEDRLQVFSYVQRSVPGECLRFLRKLWEAYHDEEFKLLIKNKRESAKRRYSRSRVRIDSALLIEPEMYAIGLDLHINLSPVNEVGAVHIDSFKTFKLVVAELNSAFTKMVHYKEDHDAFSGCIHYYANWDYAQNRGPFISAMLFFRATPGLKYDDIYSRFGVVWSHYTKGRGVVHDRRYDINPTKSGAVGKIQRSNPKKVIALYRELFRMAYWDLHGHIRLPNGMKSFRESNRPMRPGEKRLRRGADLAPGYQAIEPSTVPVALDTPRIKLSEAFRAIEQHLDVAANQKTGSKIIGDESGMSAEFTKAASLHAADQIRKAIFNAELERKEEVRMSRRVAVSPARPGIGFRGWFVQANGHCANDAAATPDGQDAPDGAVGASHTADDNLSDFSNGENSLRQSERLPAMTAGKTPTQRRPQPTTIKVAHGKSKTVEVQVKKTKRYGMQKPSEVPPLDESNIGTLAPPS